MAFEGLGDEMPYFMTVEEGIGLNVQYSLLI
jgi:hypothetical protein